VTELAKSGWQGLGVRIRLGQAKKVGDCRSS